MEKPSGIAPQIEILNDIIVQLSDNAEAETIKFYGTIMQNILLEIQELLIRDEFSLDAIEGPFFLFDKAGEIFLSNKRARELFGETKQTLFKDILLRIGIQPQQQRCVISEPLTSYSSDVIGVLRENGNQRFFQVTCRPVIVPKQNIENVIPLDSEKENLTFYQSHLIEKSNQEALRLGLTHLQYENRNEMITLLAAVTEEEDPKDTAPHLERTSIYCGKLAKNLQKTGKYSEITDKFIEDIILLSPLHDIGKIFISKSILHKTEEFDILDKKIMDMHVLLGYELAKTLNLPQMALEIILHHHSRWAGNGYPLNHISGESIPLAGRIASIVDVFDALY